MTKIINKTRFNKDCFAYKEKGGHMGCKALKEMNCKHCKFYRNDITETEIEQDVRHYANTYKK